MKRTLSLAVQAYSFIGLTKPSKCRARINGRILAQATRSNNARQCFEAGHLAYCIRLFLFPLHCSACGDLWLTFCSSSMGGKP